MNISRAITWKIRVAAILLAIVSNCQADEPAKPNILFIFSDDHATAAISAYGGRLKDAAPTPNIDSIAREGVIFRNSFCANSICGPSRATILTGLHSHANGFLSNGRKEFDQSQWTVAKELQKSGYNTAVIGKWHLRATPVGFDHFEVFPGQGNYYNPVFLQMDGSKKQVEGYATDLVTDMALDWLKKDRDSSKPFFLMCQHKAPHRTFSPALRHLGAFDDVEIPEPETLFDQYENRSKTLAVQEMEIDQHFSWAYDAKIRKDEREGIELPAPDRYGTPEYNRMNGAQKEKWDAWFGPKNKQFLADFKSGKLSDKDIVRWKYRRYMRNYLSTVKAVDESVGRLLEYLDETGLAENTIVIYSSDQGFYLGEHGWYDKRWMFEESLKMPFVARWPGVIKPGLKPDQMIQNIDYASTFLDVAGMQAPDSVHGKSFLPIMKGESPADWRRSIYYAYYEEGGHGVPLHFGVRTESQKLMYFPKSKEWNLFDLAADPKEMNSYHDSPAYADARAELTDEFQRLREKFAAPPMPE